MVGNIMVTLYGNRWLLNLLWSHCKVYKCTSEYCVSTIIKKKNPQVSNKVMDSLLDRIRSFHQKLSKNIWGTPSAPTDAAGFERAALEFSHLVEESQWSLDSTWGVNKPEHNVSRYQLWAQRNPRILQPQTPCLTIPNLIQKYLCSFWKGMGLTCDTPAQK